MGVRATLLTVAPIAASKTQAVLLGVDIVGLLASAELKCQEAMQILSVLNTDVFTPAGDATAQGIMTAQTTALN